MTSDDSIRIDASTVHRASDVQSPSVEELTDTPQVEPTAEAKTVIRGSSRVQRDLRSIGRTPASVAKILLGKHLDHFKLEEMIGGGGMGAVFRAHDEKLDRIVAIKVIPFVGDDQDLQRRFRNEAQSAAKLDHPRIARVFETGDYDDWHYIVFEYIHGTNIRDLVNQAGVLNVDDAVFYTCELAEALQHASDRGIVHRDIKPSNVLIGEENKIKLVDMGLARSDNLELSGDETASGVTLGTFDYISPEQASDPRLADLRSDIYSLGCTLYFMLTGSPPFPGGTMLQKLLSHGSTPPPDVSRLRSGVSSELSAVIRKMLAKKPEDRYQTATDLIADLRQVASRDGLVRSKLSSPLIERQPPPLVMWLQRHTPWLIAVSLLLFSATWLHFSSARTRDQFTLPSAPIADSSDVSQVTPVSPSANGVGATSKLPDAPPDPAPIPLETDSPRMEFPIPLELKTDSAPLPDDPASDRDELLDVDDAEVMPGEGNDDPSLDVDVADQLEATSFDGIAPDVIRVLRPREAMDVLADPIERLRGGVLMAVSLAEALKFAEQYGVDEIEIAAQVIYSEPITVDIDGLLIRSSVGGSVIIFESRGIAPLQRAEMIKVTANSIDMDDLHLVWTVPSSQVDGGAMFAVNENRSIRMTDCSITVENLSSQESVYAFDIDIQSDSDFESETFDVEESLPWVAIELNNVIVRGQMTMIDMDYAAELHLQWDNGLLAVTERMIDTGGSLIRPLLTSPSMMISLTRLTAHVPLGLLRMRLGVGQYPMVIDREANSSGFVVDADMPHVEIVGVDSRENGQSIVGFHGVANAYDVDRDLFNRILSITDKSGIEDVTQAIDLHMSTPAWFADKSARWSVRWDQPLASVTPSLVLPQNYLQKGLIVSGFDGKALPQLPAFGNIRVDTDTRVGGTKRRDTGENTREL